MTIKVSAVENEIGRVKCYQAKDLVECNPWRSRHIYPWRSRNFMYTPSYGIRLLKNHYAVVNEYRDLFGQQKDSVLDNS